MFLLFFVRGRQRGGLGCLVFTLGKSEEREERACVLLCTFGKGRSTMLAGGPCCRCIVFLRVIGDKKRSPPPKVHGGAGETRTAVCCCTDAHDSFCQKGLSWKSGQTLLVSCRSVACGALYFVLLFSHKYLHLLFAIVKRNDERSAPPPFVHFNMR